MGSASLTVEQLAVAQLVPYERNARTHSAFQVGQIAAAIREFGWTNPILVDEANLIIAGHGRLAAAKSIGLEVVPCIRLLGLSDDQKRALGIADNKLALNAGWDEALLAAELQSLGDLQGLVGFSEGELLRLFKGHSGLTDPDEAPPAPAEPVTQPGELWRLGEHRLLCGDATRKEDVDRVLGRVRPQLMVTDPPYGVGYDPAWRAKTGVNLNRAKLGKVANDDRSDWREAWALFPGSAAYVWHAGRHASIVQDSLEAAGFEIRCQIIWSKDRFALSRGHYHWQHEPCWYAVRAAAGSANWQGDRAQSTVWHINAREDQGLGHGTQKPVECMRRPIENNSSPGQAVYEPFSGSGTTIIAAEMMGRVCHGLEIVPAYVDVAVLRWQAFTGKQATDEAGRPFDAIAAERQPKAA